jgi:hypothetical protein
MNPVDRRQVKKFKARKKLAFERKKSFFFQLKFIPSFFLSLHTGQWNPVVVMAHSLKFHLPMRAVARTKDISNVPESTRGRSYYHNFLRFLPIFCEKIGALLKNHCYDLFFAKTSSSLREKCNFFRQIFQRMYLFKQ